MSKSKSGLIRQAIGPRKARLRLLTTEATSLLDKADDVDHADIAAKPKLGADIQKSLAKLDSSIKGIEESRGQWQRLIESLSGDDVDNEEAVHAQFLAHGGSYIDVLDDAKEHFQLLSVALKQLRLLDTQRTNNEGGSASKTAKLPKLILPEFQGDPMLWSQFWAIFKTNIDNTALQPVEKLTYLRGQLRGEALTAIEGLEISDNSYATAKAILKDRFERSPEKVIDNLYSQLKSLQPATSTVSDLRRTFDQCERIFRQLKSEGEDIDSNRSLVMDIMSKYPKDVLTELSRRDGIGTHRKVSDVQTALRKYIDETDNLQGMFGDLEPFERGAFASLRTDSHKQPQKQSSTPNNRSTPLTPFSSTLATVDKSRTIQRDNRTPPPCYFCDSPHLNAQCDRFPTLDQRLRQLEARGRCKRCMSSAHTTSNCRVPPLRLKCYSCYEFGGHPTPLCPKQFGQPSDDRGKSTRKPVPMGSSEPTKSATALCHEEKSLLSTAVTTVSNPDNGSITRARIVLDCGSHRSYVSDKLAKQLHLTPGRSDTLHLIRFGEDEPRPMLSSQVRIRISLRGGRSIVIHANTSHSIVDCPLTPTALPEEAQQLINSMRDELADDFGGDRGPPDILIGSDYFWLFFTNKPRIHLVADMFLIPSTLGYILAGRYPCETSLQPDAQPSLLCITQRLESKASETNLCMLSSDRKPSEQPDVDQYWRLETIGINDDPVEKDDEVALQQFNSTAYLQDGRYHVQWPWKEGKDRLPTNYQLALGRLRSLAKRLSAADPVVRQEYKKVIDNQLDDGVIECVPDNDRWDSANVVHYLPHHPIVRVGHATTKVRIVYDASAKCHNDQPSLNDCLYRGPVILPDLCMILIRFRLHPVAIVADIEKAFLQICLQPSERDATRFLWFVDPDNPDVSQGVVTLRFTRVPFGAIASPFLLGATIRRHLDSVNSPTAKLIRDNIYVDNVIVSVSEESEATQFRDESKSILASAGFKLRQWCTNSNAVVNEIPPDDRTASRTVKVLGIQWDSRTDLLRIHNDWSSRASCRTKREILQATASIYDPLGLLQPYTQRAKCFIRELWNCNTSWDETISEPMQQKWVRLHAEMTPMFAMTIPRRVGPQCCDDDRMTLVVFADASIDTYAAAVYLRCRDDSSKWSSNLLFAKSRLTPRKSKSISLPRLELLGLAIAARATEFVRRALAPANSVKAFLLTDSSCVLGWLQSEKPLPKFVDNRIRSIRSLSNVEFHHVRSGDNVADIASRGLTGLEIIESSLWWKGPSWLQHDDSMWPTRSVVDVVTEATIQHATTTSSGPPVFQSLLVGESLGEPERPPPFGIDVSRYSSLNRLVRVIAWCTKFVRKQLWQRLSQQLQESYPTLRRIFDVASVDDVLTTSEIGSARSIWISYVQANAFADAIESLQEGKRCAIVKQLHVQLDEYGVLRCFGRLRHAELSPDAITPILLPKNDPFTTLIIKHCHESLMHAGVGHTLSQMRRRYWVPQGRNVVRRTINKCLVCRRVRGPPFALPDMPPWPRERLARSSPFQFTGLDYYGPVTVDVHGTTNKMCVCMFTCLAVRAIHLEPVSDCTAQTFIDCLSRFMARRGAPEQIISDNAPQFRLAKTLFDRTWHRTLTDPAVLSYVSNKGVVWKFTTELAPWQGGFYERLIGLVKSAYRSTVGRKLLRWEHFATLTVEIEAIVNSRPITYVHSDIDSGLALRPMDFLVESPTGSPDVNPTTPLQGGEASRLLMSHWKSKQRRLNLLWRQWHSDYLLSMRERGSTKHKKGRSDIDHTPSLGEVVLVRDSDAPRGCWKLGRITDVIKGGDGRVRSAQLTLPNGYVIRRAINHLYRLEIPATSGHTDSDGEPAEQPNDNEIQHDASKGPQQVDNTRHDMSVADDEAVDGFSPDEAATAEDASYQFHGRSELAGLLVQSQQQIYTGLVDNAVPLTFEAVNRQ